MNSSVNLGVHRCCSGNHSEGLSVVTKLWSIWIWLGCHNIQSYNSASAACVSTVNKSIAAGKHLLHLELRDSHHISDLSPIQQWSNMALSPCCMKNHGAVVRTYSDTTDNNLQALFFPPQNFQYWEKQPTEQLNFCLQTLHSRYSWEAAKKTVWWKLMSYAIKPVRGMLIIVCFLVCLFSFSPILPLLFISQWQAALSHLRAAHLSVISHS